MSDRVERGFGRGAAAVVAVATALVIVALAVLPFLNPLWVGFEQERAGAIEATGYSRAELEAATGAILADLVFGPPAFDVEIGGEPVLNERERGHMTDVRTVFAGFAVLGGLAAVALVAAWLRAGRGGPAARHGFWGAVGLGATALAVGVVALGVVALVAFDALFEVFHRLFFAGGTYTFDPLTERLVQLFPFQFWFETALAVGTVIVLVSIATALVARRRGRSDARSADTAPSAALEAAR